MIKICTVCSINYEANKNSKYCAECRKIKNREIWKKTREKNKEKRNLEYKEWIGRGDNKNKVAERMKTYNKKYKETHVEERKKYRKTKSEIDENYKIEQKIRSKLHTFFKSTKNKYNSLFGCKTNEFKQWLEYNFSSDMSWDNYGVYWNMDHVIPVSVFNLLNEEEQNFCFNWKNTRPLLCEKNFSRKYSYKDIMLHELKTYCFSIKNSNFNNMNYGISYLPIQTRNCLEDLVNH